MKPKSNDERAATRTFSCSGELWTKIIEAAAAEGLSVSKFMQKALQSYLSERIHTND